MILDHALLVGCGNCSSVIPDWNRGKVGRLAVIFSSSSRRPSLSISRYPTVVSMCKARSNKRNPDFTRKYRGSSSKGKRQSQERENSENLEDNLFPSKNGHLVSHSNNQRYSATATPGRREKEIVELFRKVQSQLRERAAIKEEKRVEAAQHGPGERGTVDSLLKLLRKHSVAQGKKSPNSDDGYDRDEPERANSFDGPETNDLFEEEQQQQSSFFVSDNLGTTQNDVCEPNSRPSSRPVSSFKRKSPVPKVKFQPIFSVEEEGIGGGSPALNSQKNITDDSSELNLELEPQTWHIHEPEHDEQTTKLGSLDVDGEMGADPSNFSDLNETDAGMPETSITQGADLSSMKVSELRGLAKSKGIKGYSKLKKIELLEVLNMNTA